MNKYEEKLKEITDNIEQLASDMRYKFDLSNKSNIIEKLDNYVYSLQYYIKQINRIKNKLVNEKKENGR